MDRISCACPPKRLESSLFLVAPLAVNFGASIVSLTLEKAGRMSSAWRLDPVHGFLALSSLKFLSLDASIAASVSTHAFQGGM